MRALLRGSTTRPHHLEEVRDHEKTVCIADAFVLVWDSNHVVFALVLNGPKRIRTT